MSSFIETTAVLGSVDGSLPSLALLRSSLDPIGERGDELVDELLRLWLLDRPRVIEQVAGVDVGLGLLQRRMSTKTGD